MSRCFPYPSLGYKVPGVRGEASIESIKIQSDGLTSKTEQKKEGKREKKERKKERKDRKEVKTVGSILKLKKLENKIEPLEKSDLTEEHGLPCYLSDGSQSSSKRKREEETQPNPAPRVLKIRINPPKMPEQPDVSAFKQLEPSSVSLVWHADNAKDLNAREPCSSQRQGASVPECSNRREKIAAPNCVGSMSTSSYDKKLNKEALRHKQLIEDWVPPALSQFVLETDDDQDWLFRSKRLERPVEKRVRTDNLHNAPEKADLWPHSRFLAEAGIHALPYTVPF